MNNNNFTRAYSIFELAYAIKKAGIGGEIQNPTPKQWKSLYVSLFYPEEIAVKLKVEQSNTASPIFYGITGDIHSDHMKNYISYLESSENVLKEVDRIVDKLNFFFSGSEMKKLRTEILHDFFGNLRFRVSLDKKIKTTSMDMKKFLNIIDKKQEELRKEKEELKNLREKREADFSTINEERLKECKKKGSIEQLSDEECVFWWEWINKLLKDENKLYYEYQSIYNDIEDRTELIKKKSADTVITDSDIKGREKKIEELEEELKVYVTRYGYFDMISEEKEDCLFLVQELVINTEEENTVIEYPTYADIYKVWNVQPEKCYYEVEIIDEKEKRCRICVCAKQKEQNEESLNCENKIKKEFSVSNGYYAEKYKQIKDDAEAIARAFMCIASGAVIGETIEMIFGKNPYKEIEKEFYKGNYKRAHELLNKREEIMKEQLGGSISELAFDANKYVALEEKINNKTISEGEIRNIIFISYYKGELLERQLEEKTDSEKITSEMYYILCEKLSGGRQKYDAELDKYIGKASYKLAIIEKSKSKVGLKRDALQRYLDKAIKCGVHEAHTLKAECLRNGILRVESKEGQYLQIYKEYIASGTSEGINKAWLLLQEHKKFLQEHEKKDDNLIEIEKELITTYSQMEDIGARHIFTGVLGAKAEFEAKEIAKRIHEKFSIDGEGRFLDVKENKVEYNENVDEVFVVLGMGDATEAFLKSIPQNEHMEIRVLVYHMGVDEKRDLENRYPGVCFDEYNEENIVKGIKIFDEEAYAEEVYKKYKNNELWLNNSRVKVHFVAISDDKSENMAFVENVLNLTWEKQCVYNSLNHYLETNTPIAVLKECVDIIAEYNSVEAELYIDSLQRNFNDFYIPIRNISYDEEVSRELLVKTPLFLPMINSNTKNTEEYSHVVILGDDESIPVLIKNIMSVGWFGKIEGDYQKENVSYEEMLSLAGKMRLKITIVDKNADAILDKLEYDCPEAFRNNFKEKCMLKSIVLDVNSRDFSCVFENEYVNLLSEQQKELYTAIQTANYYVCAMKKDEDAIALAMKLRRTLLVSDESFSKIPVISVLCRNLIYGNKINSILYNGQILNESWFYNFKINVYGIFNYVYSYENMYKNAIAEMGFEIHKQYYANDAFGEDDAKKMYYSSQYCRDSSEISAVYFPYRLFTAGVFDGLSKWDYEEFNENIRDYIERYEEFATVVNNEKLLSIYEHMRWCYYMISRSWKTATKTQVQNYIEKGNTSHQLHIAKLHPYLVSFEELGERDWNETQEKVLSLEEDWKACKINCCRVCNNIVANYFLEKKRDYVELNNKKFTERNIIAESFADSLKYIEEVYGEISLAFEEENITLEEFDEQLILTLSTVEQIINYIDSKMADNLVNVRIADIRKEAKELRDELALNKMELDILFLEVGQQKFFPTNFKTKINEIVSSVNQMFDVFIAKMCPSGTGVQGWIDNLLWQHSHVKMANASVRQGNSNMIKDTIEIYREYLVKEREKTMDRERV